MTVGEDDPITRRSFARFNIPHPDSLLGVRRRAGEGRGRQIAGFAVDALQAGHNSSKSLFCAHRQPV
jgi:hypothetical protein